MTGVLGVTAPNLFRMSQGKKEALVPPFHKPALLDLLTYCYAGTLPFLPVRRHSALFFLTL